MKLITKYYSLSPKDNLPKEIENPEELIKKITRKVTINSDLTNLNETFIWIKLAKRILKRFYKYNEKLITELKYNLVSVLIDNSEYNYAKKLLNNVIRIYKKQDRLNKMKLSMCYRYMAKINRHLGEYSNALKEIYRAIKFNENNFNCYSEYAEILLNLKMINEADKNYLKAYNLCKYKKGENNLETMIICFNYGIFLALTDNTNSAKIKMNKAYRFIKKNVDEVNLYTIRMIDWFGYFIYKEGKYNEAMIKKNKAFLSLKDILGNNSVETLNTKDYCAEISIRIKKYSNAVDYMDWPLVISDYKGITILMAYNNKIMKAPKIYLIKKTTQIVKLLDEFKQKNVPIIDNPKLARKMIKDCKQFSTLPYKYQEYIASMIVRHYFRKRRRRCK